jgi:hypothetical protein
MLEIMAITITAQGKARHFKTYMLHFLMFEENICRKREKSGEEHKPFLPDLKCTCKKMMKLPSLHPMTPLQPLTGPGLIAKGFVPVWCSAVQCSAVQCSAVQCSAVQCSAVQCSAVQCSAVQFSAVQCSAVQCSAVQCTRDIYG